MSIQIERSVDDPIVRFIFEGTFDDETIQEVRTQTAGLLNEMGVFYAVIDLRGTETTFGEAVALLEPPETPGLSANERVHLVFLGQPVPDDPTNLFNAPVFMDKDAAFEYIRREIASNAPGN